MNAVFAVIFILSSAVITIFSPNTLLSAMTDGAEKSLELCFTLMVVYSVWLGVFQILEDGKLTERLSFLLRRPVAFIFGKTSEEAQKYLALNVTANLFGLGSVATPMGIKAAEFLSEEDNRFASAMLFSVAATSLQILPTTAITLRAEYGSQSPADIFLPTLLSTAVSTVCAVVLTRIFVKR